MRRAFTFIELLFVMAIVAILTGYGVFRLGDSSRAAYKSTMEVDLENIITRESIFFKRKDFFDSFSGSYEDSIAGRIVGENGGKFSVSKHNSITVQSVNCNPFPGYKVVITNDRVNESLHYSSCSDQKTWESES